MAGLIPLMLRSSAGSSRQSLVFPTGPSPTSPKTKMPQSPKEQSSRPASTALPVKPRARRLSQQTPVHIPVLPYTAAEWSKAVSEVKRQYLNRRYRPCSVRCNEILDNTKDTSMVEPAYLIYLHFYAANSLEMSARPLYPSSPYRMNLLRQARTHYNRASELIQAEDISMKRFSRPASTSTNSSSMHSPACSVSSRAWTESTGFSSPTPSLYSLEDAVEKMVQPAAPVKKRVTFSDMIVEPIIRPDSPTLGFDDWLGRSSPEPQPAPVPEPEPILEEHPDEPPRMEHDADDALFLRERSIHRYCTVLTSLRSQLTAHLESVESQLAKPSAVDFLPGRSSPEMTQNNDELRTLEVRARIERLRQNGWQRKRFDPTRYEALREQVLAELA